MKRTDDDRGPDAADGSGTDSGDATRDTVGSPVRPDESVDRFVPSADDAAGDATGDGGATDAAVRSDGGTVDSPFETTASIEETRSDRFNRFFRDFVRTPLGIIRNDWRGVVGFAIVSAYVLVGIMGPYFVKETEPAHGDQLLGVAENMRFPLGTTGTGKDLMSLMVYSTEPILLMMASGAVFTVVAGTTVGVVAGYKGGMVDTVLSSITDVFINLPGLPLVIVLATLLEEWIQSPVVLGVVLAVAAWAGLARALRSQVLTIRSESFVESARAMDLSTRWILAREVLPHLMPYIAVNMVNAARRVIFAAVALYFLGVLPYRAENWGVILNNAYEAGAIYRDPAVHWIVIPMVTISGISVGLILLAQSLDRVFNPRARAKHEGGTDTVETDDEDDTGTTDMMKV